MTLKYCNALQPFATNCNGSATLCNYRRATFCNSIIVPSAEQLEAVKAITERRKCMANNRQPGKKEDRRNYAKERPWRNNEGYCDPTASAALRNIEHEEKREARKNRTIIYRKAYA